MASLLSDLEKEALEQVIDNVHDTFKRKIIAYKEAKIIIMSTDPNFNSIYQQSTQQVAKEVIKREFEARIYYYRKSQERRAINATPEDHLAIQMSEGEVRLKVKKEDYDFIKDVERIEFDGQLFRLASEPRPHSLFSTRYFSLTLKRVN